MQHPKSIQYLLNNHDEIVSINGPWDKFAIENDGVNLRAENICGRQIWDFIVDGQTTRWLETIFNNVRLKNEALVRPYRCDSPDTRRFMAMTVSPAKNDGLLIDHRVIHTDPRNKPIPITFNQYEDQNEVKLRCSICGRINHNQVWREPTPAIAGTNGAIQVVYGVCPECRASAQ